MEIRYLDIVSEFRKSLGICSSLTGTYFKIQSKLTHFIKQFFLKQQIGGPTILKYWASLEL